MVFSENGERLLMEAEGFVGTVKPDAAGHLTIGYGHKIKPGEKYTVISREGALKLMRKDCEPIVNILNNYIPVKMNQNQFDALVMFIYNIGEVPFLNSTVFKDLKAQKLESAIMPWERWINITKRTVDKKTGEIIKKLVPCKGLINRRAMEIKLFNS